MPKMSDLTEEAYGVREKEREREREREREIERESYKVFSSVGKVVVVFEKRIFSVFLFLRSYATKI